MKYLRKKARFSRFVNKILRAKTHLFLIIGLLVLFSFLPKVSPPRPVDATITDGMNASDVLGQRDPVTGLSVYTKGGINNGPNNKGFWLAYAVAIDTTNHRLFVSDNNNNRVLVFNLNTDNTLPDRVADYVLGQPDFITNSQGTTQSQFGSRDGSVKGLAYDSAGNRLFVVDSGNNRVMVFDVASITNGENAVNVLGQTDYTTSASGTTQAKLNAPNGLTYDSVGNRLFAADINNSRVMVFDVASITNGEAAVNVLGQTDYTTSASGTTQAKLKTPYGLTYDSTGNRLFVVDTGNRRVLVYDLRTVGSLPNLCEVAAAGLSNGMNASCVLGQADFTSSNIGISSTGLSGPVDSVYDSAGNRLFVSDSGNSRVMVFDVASITNGEAAVNVLGQTVFTGWSGGLTQGKFSDVNGGVEGLAFDSVGNRLFAADAGNSRVMVFNTTSITNGDNAIDLIGQTDPITGNPVYTKNGFNNGPNNDGFYAPTYITVDTVNHRLFVSDSSYNRVLVFNLDSSNVLADYTADYVLGQADFVSNGGGTTQSNINDPRGLVYDSTGNRLFVVDSGNNRVMVFDVASITNGENAVNVLGQTDYTTSSSGTTQSKLKTPVGLAYDSGGKRLFVADRDNGRVIVFDVASITDGEPAVNVLGQPDFTTSSFGTTQNKLARHSGLAYDSTNSRLFVLDLGDNNRVMVFDVASITNGEPAVNVLGQTDYTTSGGLSTTQSKFNGGGIGSEGLEYDNANSRLFVSDAQNNRVMVFDVASITNGENAVNVLGQTDYATLTAGITQSKISGTRGLAYDSTSGRLYVSDSSNNRLMVFTINIPPVATTPASISQATDGTGYVTFQTAISDADNENTRLKVEFSDDSGTTWYDADVYSVTPSTGTVDFDDSQTYQIGSVNPIDTSTGSVTLTIVWDTKGVGNGKDISATDSIIMKARVTPNDASTDGTAVSSNAFSLYNAAPTGLGTLASTSPSTTYVNLNWSAVTETNFGHYEIWYGTNQAAVQARTAAEWDNDNDNLLSVKATTSTRITGLTPGTAYYFKIWAVDSYGNESTITDLQVSTTSPGSSQPLDTTAPGPITGISGVYQNSCLTLSWINPTDSDFRQIELWRNQGGSTPVATQVTTLSSTATTYADCAVIQDQTYQYQFATTDTSQNRTLSQIASLVARAGEGLTTTCGNNLCEQGESATSCAQDCGTSTPGPVPVLEMRLTAQIIPSFAAASVVELSASAPTSSVALALALSVLLLGAFMIHTHTGSANNNPLSFFAIFPLLFTSSNNSYMYLRRCKPADCHGPHFTRHKALKHFTRASLAASVVAGAVKLFLLIAFTTFIPAGPSIFAQEQRVFPGETIQTTLSVKNTGLIKATNPIITCPVPNNVLFGSVALNQSAQPSNLSPVAGVLTVPFPDLLPNNTYTVNTNYQVTSQAVGAGVLSFSCTGNAGGLATAAVSNTVTIAVAAPVVTETTPAVEQPVVPAEPEPLVEGPAAAEEQALPAAEQGTVSLEVADAVSVLPLTGPTPVSAPIPGPSPLIIEPQVLEEPKAVEPEFHALTTIAKLDIALDQQVFLAAATVPQAISVTISISGQLENRQDIDFLELVIESNPQVIAFRPQGDSWSISTPVDLPAGHHKLYVLAVDFQGQRTPISNTVEFDITLPACFDGMDNDEDNLIDYPADTGCESRADQDEYQAPAEIIEIITAPLSAIIPQNVIDTVEQTTTKIIQSKTYQVIDKKVLNNPEVEKVNVQVAAPVIVATAVANAGTAVSFASLLTYLQAIVTQPFLLFTRKRRKQWGLVYSALTKLPVDLALVRLFSAQTDKLVQTRVTDKQGRYLFLANPGAYRIQVAKPGFSFPSQFLKDQATDLDITNLYHGETITVTNQSTTIIRPIPMDPVENTETPKKVRSRQRRRQVQKTVAWAGPVFAMASVMITPTLTTTSLLVLQFVLLGLFKRLAEGNKKPKSWGSVVDVKSNKPISFAVARIFDAQFNKLLETQITDKNGRYAFLVGKGNFYITVEKAGYTQYKSENLDLSREGTSDIVKQDIRMKRGG